jgi:inhibitor of KinA sporulation pathway (predicted exonuclease)
MPSIEEQDIADQDTGYWLAFNVDGSEFEQSSATGTNTGRMLLRVFPLIRREKVQENFWLMEKDRNDQGCVYSKGTALYIDE